jgi:triosephosphate isomerase
MYDDGAHTGDISGLFLKALECSYVIVGHSERRANHREDNGIVAAKSRAAIRHSLVPIVCVGETAEDLETHGAAKIPVEQLTKVLEALDGEDNYVVAYEPVWAIGSGQAATPDQANDVAAALRETIAQVHGSERADSTRILYGGSVKATNIATLMKRPDVDGALVGGGSLDVSEFTSIIQFPKHVTLDS